MGTKTTPGKFDCYAALDPDEPHFVLKATDPQAPDLVRKWAADRERKLDEPVLYVGGRWEQPNAEYVARQKAKIAEARYCAAQMEVWRYEREAATNG